VARVRVRLFAAAREAAGHSEASFDAATVDDVLAQASLEYGDRFTAVLATARIWVNGDEPTAQGATALDDDDEVAVLPPVSGG
jgi:molybdopterin synthase sulfur carrier subunit